MESNKGVAIVTGAAGSIGQATAKKFLSEGFRVGLSSRNREVLEEFRKAFDPEGTSTLPLIRNLDDPNWSEQSVSEVMNAWGKLDVLATCSGGIKKTGSWSNLTNEDWLDAYVDNLLDPFSIIRSSVPHMKGRGGRVVCVASFVAEAPGSWNPHYSAAKAALIHLVKHLARNLSSEGITVNSVSPAYTMTSGLLNTLRQQIETGNEETDSAVEQLIQLMSNKLPIKRLISADEVAETIIFLANSSRVISGENITVDAGMSLIR